MERDCQVNHEATEPHAVDCVRVHLDACSLSEVLFKGGSESAARVPVDEMEVERSEEAVVKESPKCSYQLSGEAEDTVQRIDSLTRTCARVLREELGRKVDNNSVASSRPDRQVALSQTEKRSDEHSTRSRVKSKECDGRLAQVGETMGLKVACSKMAELELRWVTRVCLDRTSEKSESVLGTAAGVELSQPIREPVKNDQWQRDGFTMLTSVPWDTRGSAVESMTGNKRKNVTDSLIQDEMPRGPAHLMASLRVTTKCQRRLGLSTNPNVIGGDPTVRRVVKGSRSVGVEASEEQFATHLDTVQRTRQTAGLERGVEDDVVASSAKRAHTIPFPLTQALLPSATGWKAVLVPGGAMRISTQCEEHVCRPDVKVGFDAAGEFRDHYNGEVPDWSLKITGTNNETTRIEKTGVPT